MSALEERLRDALAPQYQVARELASGGMGLVFLGRDVALDRRVAIKIIRPELATARAAERFLREAQILANLSHPNIVPVHHVGETGGFFYYVMDYLEGETLADRLRRGPLSGREALKLGRDLLDALEAAHRHRVVHRDIKPANIFLIDSRAVLADFGIAKPSASRDRVSTGEQELSVARRPSLTEPGAVVGTPPYMPPEQATGGEVTERTDLYAVGMVLYEAYTGRHWPVFDPLERADWSGAPARVARVLRRALEWAPEDRWPDAAAFRRALWRTRVRPYQLRTFILTVLGLAVGAGAAYEVRRRDEQGLWPFTPSGVLGIEVQQFQVSAGVDRQWLGDSLERALVRSLTGYPDFSVHGPRASRWVPRRSTMALTGSVRADGESLRVEVQVRSSPRGGQAMLLRARGTVARWELLIDTLAYDVVREIWNRENPLDPSLPYRALPKTPAGLAAWLRAERLLAQARWGQADSAYHVAEALDTTCWLCAWRHAEVERWLGREPDPARFARYLHYIDSFPPRYQSLIRVSRLSVRARLDTLEAATERWRNFFLAWFRRGDELYHRGPLVGHARSEAIAALKRAAQLRPDFAPAWEHLTWALAAEGDAVEARAAFDSLKKTGEPRDPYAGALRGLFTVGLAWRFRDSAFASEISRELLSQPRIASYPDLAAGPRFLPTFDAPQGAVEMGGAFASRKDRPDLERSGLIAQIFGYLALGQPDSALAVAGILADRFPDRELTLLGPELEGALLLLDPDSARTAWPSVRVGLEARARARSGSEHSRRRAAWMLSLLAGRFVGGTDPGRYRSVVEGEPGPRLLHTVLAASEFAAGGERQRALATTDSLAALSASELYRSGPIDPLFRAVLHLLRAEWFEREGNSEDAERELLWYQNNDVSYYPTGNPQVSDADWAFGTLARWRLARLLERSPSRREAACRAYSDVKRLWSRGDTRYRARADSASRRLASLKCGASP